jgi:hypothetical protein
MRAYIAASGLLFGLLVVVHAVRSAVEGFDPLGQPVFLGTTLASAAMSAWAWSEYKKVKPSAQD